MLAVSPNVASQQGTSRSLYHAVVMDASRTYEFFTNLNSTPNVYKNIDQNKLSIGEAMAIKRIYLSTMVFNPASVGQEEVTAIATPATIPAVIAGKIDLVVGNQTVIKDLPITKMLPTHNRDSRHINHFYVDLENELILKSNIEFKVVIKQMGIVTTAPVNTRLCLTLDGYGKIYNSRESI
jgi:hypothetical protein